MLFSLVQSLSKNEKRYINLQGGKGKTKHLKLISIYESMREYDGAKLKQMVHEQGLSNNLSFLKNYTIDFILRQLRLYHEDDNIQYSLNNSLHELELLAGKGIYKLAERRYKKSLQKALLHESHNETISLLRWYKAFFHRKHVVSDETELDILKACTRQISEQLELLSRENRLQSFMDEFILLYRMGKGYKEGPQKAEQLMDRLQAAFPDLPQTCNSKILYHQCNMHYHLIQLDYNNARVYAKNILDTMDAYPAIKTASADRYTRYMHNYLNICFVLKRFDELDEKLKELKTDDILSADKSMIYTAQILSLKVLLTINTSVPLERAQLFSRELEKESAYLKKLTGTQQLFTLYYNRMILYWLTGEQNKAESLLNEILDTRAYQRRDRHIYAFGKVLLLTFYYDNQLNSLAANNLIQNTERWLRKASVETQLEKLILRYLKKLFQPHITRKERQQYFEGLLSELTEYRAQLNGKYRTGLSETIIWVRHKLSGNSMWQVNEELVKESERKGDQQH